MVMHHGELRRRDDVLLAEIDKRLALLEQAQAMEARTREAQAKALELQIASIGARVDNAISLWQSVSAEPVASAAGRAVIQRIEPLERMVDEHDDFIQQSQGALRLAKFAVGASLIALAASIIDIIRAMS